MPGLDSIKEMDMLKKECFIKVKAVRRGRLGEMILAIYKET